ncbi:unnamed protein product [Clonostachys rhizophaga]|uniref:Uncharacterized protein n=1 Tax=Clonostachys rhizophaga TaxID=160324 RepID=A0A9N9UZS6_9HYPO|nr:unnamed protein product [Clonostachys rhizophaga]
MVELKMRHPKKCCEQMSPCRQRRKDPAFVYSDNVPDISSHTYIDGQVLVRRSNELEDPSGD